MVDMHPGILLPPGKSPIDEFLKCPFFCQAVVCPPITKNQIVPFVATGTEEIFQSTNG